MPMVLSYAYCNVAVMPVRREPFHSSEQVTQLLFGEKAEIQQVNSRDWALIRCGWDDYEGWCKLSQLSHISRKDYRKEVKYCVAGHGSKLLFLNSEMPLPPGSELYGMKGGHIKVQGAAGKFKGGKMNWRDMEPSFPVLREVAMSYLNAPYQWGGRSPAGIDCSGLTQLVFKMCNLRLPRDASQQAEMGDVLDFLQHARCGDLAFFEEREGQINHVGMLLDTESIIHATDTAGRVVIDRIDQGGIISLSLKRRTHKLRMVRRMKW